ncbi:MAG TPA: nucleotidyl transferase AbiEii/AbiGii toxin family protein [Bryobacterales bacterium]|nr:nucleotidyl transferase AbiEii/AbiGii toxin family protein [Bryobacterales bacterium]
MSALEAALVEVASTLESFSLPYMLIGGLAVSMWGEPRATLDIDVTLWVEPEHFEQAVGRLCERLRASPQDPLAFARRTRVLPATTSQGVRVDIVFAALPAEREAIRRACPKQVSGKKIMVAAAEDLVLMKLASEREKGLEDARRLLRRHSRSLDRNYLEPRVADLADALGRPDLMDVLREGLA